MNQQKKRGRPRKADHYPDESKKVTTKVEIDGIIPISKDLYPPDNLSKSDKLKWLRSHS